MDPDRRRDGVVGPQPDETPKQRADRELNELLAEIRIALPGLELLFGFLLILPFTDRFDAIAGFERIVYLGSFLSTAAAAALFIAPTARHRLGFRRVDKQDLLVEANRQVLAGLGLVTLAVALAVFLAVSVAVDGIWAAVTAAAVAAWFAAWWFVIPLRRRTAEARRPG
jgi:Na+/melibiose symporter-like transporter